MCGLLFQASRVKPIDENNFIDNLKKMHWRGPDALNTHSERGGSIRFGHCRLSVIDPSPRANQPMVSNSKRYIIIFNGEIYNHLYIRKKLNLSCSTSSDTETIVEAYALIGEKIFSMLEGMFALVIYDIFTERWIACRDAFGIKPLYLYQDTNNTVIASEPSVVAAIVGARFSETSLIEWRIARRPVPGYSFFTGVKEVLPASIIDCDGGVKFHWNWYASTDHYSQEEFEEILSESVRSHELSDVENVSLISGGLDSAVILALSEVKKTYTVGMPSNNEFEGAADTTSILGRHLTKINIDTERLRYLWVYLTKIRGEPLALPNEALIYSACSSMRPSEKVVLTGEGADELLFGYDKIFRWVVNLDKIDSGEFLKRYGYSNILPTERLVDFIESLKFGKKPIDFLEDYFYQFHLPGLLRRMDFASMAASKEARVPFVNKRIIKYMYRRHSSIKIDNLHSKLPLRAFATKLGLVGALQRKKIGFSAQVQTNEPPQNGYTEFQNIVIGALR